MRNAPNQCHVADVLGRHEVRVSLHLRQSFPPPFTLQEQQIFRDRVKPARPAVAGIVRRLVADLHRLAVLVENYLTVLIDRNMEHPGADHRLSKRTPDVILALVLLLVRFDFIGLAERNKNLLAAVAVGYYTGLRESDVITMLRRERKSGSIQTRAGKTGERIWIPEHPELQAILGPYLAQRDVEREVHSLKLDAEELILNRRREPYTTNGFQGSFFKIIRELKAEGAVDGGLTFHGLRTSCATAVAEAGCSAPQLMAVMGWKTLAMAEHYTRDAERRRLAGQALTMLLAAEDAVKTATS